MDTTAQLVFLAVVGARFLVPLLIPRFPLPAIIACLVLDGVDQTIFQTMGYDPPGYQGYDKAMDVFYLCVAYLSTMRNWTSEGAFRVGRFLYFYRLVGVAAFELTQWRPLLLIFPNTFEYFFIAYEVVRLRWDPARYGLRFWVWTAGLIWVFVKLPQEYWIHIAQLDFTDTLENVPWFGPAIVLALLGLLAVLWFAVRPRLRPADWSWRVAADPLPEEIDEAAERASWVTAHGRVLSAPTVEKVVLVGLISMIYGLVLPSVEASSIEPLHRHRRVRRDQRRARAGRRPGRADGRVAVHGVRRAGGRQHRPGAAGVLAPRSRGRRARPRRRRVLRDAAEPDHRAPRPLLAGPRGPRGCCPGAGERGLSARHTGSGMPGARLRRRRPPGGGPGRGGSTGPGSRS